MKNLVKMTLTEKEKEIQQLNMCIETIKIIARKDKTLSNLCREKIRMYRALIKKLQKSESLVSKQTTNRDKLSCNT